MRTRIDPGPTAPDRARCWCLLLAAAAFVAAACARGEDDTQEFADAAASAAPLVGEAQIRVVNAISGGPAIDLYSDTHLAFSGVQPRDVTGYQPVAEYRPTLRALRAGSTEGGVLAQEPEAELSGRYYTVVAASGPPGAPTRLEVIRDDTPPPDAMRSRIRLVNAAPNAGVLDVFLEGADGPLFAGVSSESDAMNRDLDVVTATLVVRPVGERRSLLRIPSLALEPGRTLTIIVTHPAPASQALEAIQVRDGMPRPGM
jgi:hypothetical protein